MALNYRNLDPAAREYMLEEIGLDIGAEVLYLSPWLTVDGERMWPRLLLAAAERHHDGWLEVRLSGLMLDNAPDDARQLLAESEFNRFYCRAICRLSLDGMLGFVRIYHAKAMDPEHPARGEISDRINRLCDAQRVLSALRAAPDVDSALGLPAGGRSGLSVSIP